MAPPATATNAGVALPARRLSGTRTGVVWPRKRRRPRWRNTWKASASAPPNACWGVSHNSITNWVKQAVFAQALKPTPAEKVEWVEADELWTYIAKKKMIAGSGGLLIVLPNRSWGGRWGIVEPKRPSGWLRNCLTPPGQVCHRLLASLRENLLRPKPCPRQGAHLYHRKLEQPHPVLSGPPQTPDAQLQQVQSKSGRQHPVFYCPQMWRGTGVKITINTYLAIPAKPILH